MVNFGPLTAEIGWRVWGTPANLNGFRVVFICTAYRGIEITAMQGIRTKLQCSQKNGSTTARSVQFS